MTPRPIRGGASQFYAVVGEPNDWTLRAITSILDLNGFQVIRTRTAAGLLEKTRATQPDLVLVSDSFPDLQAVDTCRVLRGMSAFNPATPILVTTTGITSEAARIAHLRAGAWDTIKMPANPEEFLLRIQRFVDVKVRSDMATAKGMLDGSTGFYNLHGLLRRTEEEISEAWRFRRTISCAVFGPVPPLGEGRLASPDAPHRARLEEELLEVFRRVARRSDVVGRLNALEYIVVAPSTDEAGSVRLCRRLLAELQHLTLPAPDSDDLVPLPIRAGYHSPGTPAPADLTPGDLVGRAVGALRAQQEAGPEASTPDSLPWETGHSIEVELEGPAGPPDRTPGTEWKGFAPPPASH